MFARGFDEVSLSFWSLFFLSQVLDDGSLFFSKMGVHHMGNYSCEDSTDPSVLQVHALKVQSKFIDTGLCVSGTEGW